jgi:hypothetical protein
MNIYPFLCLRNVVVKCCAESEFEAHELNLDLVRVQSSLAFSVYCKSAIPVMVFPTRALARLNVETLDQTLIASYRLILSTLYLCPRDSNANLCNNPRFHPDGIIGMELTPPPRKLMAIRSRWTQFTQLLPFPNSPAFGDIIHLSNPHSQHLKLNPQKAPD